MGMLVCRCFSALSRMVGIGFIEKVIVFFEKAILDKGSLGVG